MLVTVEEAPATSIGYGGGVEGYTKSRNTGPDGQPEDHFELAPRGFFDIGRRNLFGANRSVSLYTRVSLRPRDAPDDPEIDGTGISFSEYRVVGTYRQPRWFGPNDLTVNMGIPNEYDHPDLIAMLQRIIDTANRRHVAAGCWFADTQQAVRTIRQGARLVVFSNDAVLLRDAFATAFAELRRG